MGFFSARGGLRLQDFGPRVGVGVRLQGFRRTSDSCILVHNDQLNLSLLIFIEKTSLRHLRLGIGTSLSTVFIDTLGAILFPIFEQYATRLSFR